MASAGQASVRDHAQGVDRPSCGTCMPAKHRLFRSSLPVAIELPGQLAAAQSNDGIGTGDGPTHAGALETGTDGDLASGFDHTGRDAQTHGTEPGVIHPMPVALDVAQTSARFLMCIGMVCQGVDEVVEVALVKFVTAVFGPLFPEFAGWAIKHPGHIPEMAFGMKQVDDLD